MTVPGTRSSTTGVQLWMPAGGGTVVMTVTTPKGGQTREGDALVKSVRLH